MSFIWICFWLTALDDSFPLPPGLEIHQSEDGSLQIDGEIHREEDAELLDELKLRHPGLRSNVKRFNEAVPQSANTHNRGRKQPHNFSENFFFEVALVEISKSFLRDWGAQFGSPIDFDLFVRPNLGVKALQVAGLNPIAGFLDLAMQKGEAKVHLKQSLLSRLGRHSSFHVGGELPLKITGKYSGSLQKISFGMSVDILPLRLDGKDVLAEIQVLSREPQSRGIDSLPSISEKKLHTQIRLRLGETLSVAGFFQESESRGRNGLPFLSEIPGIGSLFSSNSFRSQKSEAYFLITPKKMRAGG